MAEAYEAEANGAGDNKITVKDQAVTVEAFSLSRAIHQGRSNIATRAFE